MTIYKRNTKIARNIYESFYGPIPKDESGRKFEIHHIDGNTENNDPKNLIALSIEEHYFTHYRQGDWGACYAIGIRMELSPEELSEFSRKTQNDRIKNGTHHFITNNPSKKRIDDGTHPWLNSEIQRQNALKRVENGTNPFTDSELAKQRNIKRVSDGTHPFLGGEIQRKNALKRVKNGTHPFLGGDLARQSSSERIKNGTHNFIGPNSPSQVQWTCEYCGKIGKGKGNYTKNHGINCKVRC